MRIRQSIQVSLGAVDGGVARWSSILARGSVITRASMAIVLVLSLASCATVKPYEREHLGDEIMTFDDQLAEDARELKWLEAREGSTGGVGGAGGGCACN